MLTKRLLEAMAMAIIGDSLLCILSPRRHTDLWLSGPSWWQKPWKLFVDNPGLTRAFGVLGLGLGLWLAWRAEEPREFEELAEAVQPHRWARRMSEVMR